ncbi:flavin-containing monooxygenase [Amycolatopsis jejuensis]|uniref:flavin-containing monooxygenase n=1 Tax=Amycolatopsis jejuensis TaxID=330084 RepID=UPI0005269D1F|nr:NAD(P)/FAD-dependent oxidoreductase [Amycolatopsis jejuensis]
MSEMPAGSREAAAVTQVDAVIVGAGFSGMYLLHKLRGAGLNTVVLEAGDGVGGTWYWNRYPGARVDVESFDYSYSFSEELQQEWEWTERYPAQPELLRYLDHVADRFDLRRDIRLGTRVTAAHYDEAAARWTVRCERGEEYRATWCVMATGCLSSAQLPAIDGIGSFSGDSYHTANWPVEGVDFTGKRVAVIGTGSSGIQSIPVIAEQAARLTVFQRTASFAVPAHNRALEPGEVEEIKNRYPELRDHTRRSMAGVSRVRIGRSSVLEATADERQEVFARAWAAGTLFGLVTSYRDVMTDRVANDRVADFVRGKIREMVDDPDTAELLCPRGFPFAAKRVCLDSGYYATFNRGNVHLIDVSENPIDRLSEHGVVVNGTEHEADVIVFATGFDAMTGSLAAIDIRGRNGRSLRDKWSAGPITCLGLQSAGFPNLFFVAGPGSPSVLSNMVLSIEQHVEWIAGCIGYARERDVISVEATGQAEQDWVRHVNEVSAALLYSEANSWYLGANVPGKPRVFMPYAGGVGAYRKRCDSVAAAGYEGFVLTGGPARSHQVR